LQYVQSYPNKVTMKEKKTRNGLRLLLTFDAITNVDKALKALEPFQK
jgi:transcription-repair coupling factor (superfamily II helicase)